MQLSVEKGVVFYISQLIQSATEQVDLSQSNSCILETSWSKHQMKMGELSQQYFLPSLKNSRPSKKKDRSVWTGAQGCHKLLTAQQVLQLQQQPQTQCRYSTEMNIVQPLGASGSQMMEQKRITTLNTTEKKPWISVTLTHKWCEGLVPVYPSL